MKIIVLHGEDNLRSFERFRKFIESAKSRSWEIVNLDESTLSIPEILSSTSLFETERFYVLREIKKLGKKELEWLNKNSNSTKGTLVIYSDDLITQLIIKNLPKDRKIEEFSIPKIIWVFLEHLYPGNSNKVLREFHTIIKTEPAEFIFSLIAKQFRDLYWTVSDPVSTGFADWKMRKLKAQLLKFKTERIKKIIKLLSKIDIDAKTGKTDLVSSLDLMIVKYLK